MDWKGARDRGYGIQSHRSDGSSSSSSRRDKGSVTKGFTSSQTTESSERNGRVVHERTSSKHDKQKGYWDGEKKPKSSRQRTETHRSTEVRNADGGSHVKSRTERTNYDGKRSRIDETSWSGKERGHYTSRRDGGEEEGAFYKVGETGPSTGDKLKALPGKAKKGLKDGVTKAKKKIGSIGSKKPPEVTDYTAKRKGPQQASKNNAWDEGDHDKARGQHDGFNSALRHMTVGAVGDEEGIDYDAFTKERQNASGAMTSSTETEHTGGSTRTTASHGVGAHASGSTLKQSSWTDESGREHKSSGGATGEASVGAKASGYTSQGWTPGGMQHSVGGQASIGAGAEGQIGATHQTKLGSGFEGQAGATAGGSAFVGARAKGDAKVTKGSSSVSAEASGEASYGAGASANAGASAGISRNGFDILAARAKGSGEAFSGYKAKAQAKAQAGPMSTGVSGSAEATAGLKASGSASAGVSVGGVDADAVAEGEVLAGAEASASGEASVGLLGASLGGQAGAFAGVRAGGQIRAELGAGGLNFGIIGINGEVSAGAGAEATGRVFAKLNETGAEAQAAAALGVGAGVGMVLSVDPSFPVRLPLQNLHENGVIPTADVAELANGAAKGMYYPGDGSAMTTVAAAKSKAGPKEVEAITAAEDQVSDFSKQAGKDALGEVKSAATLGGGLLTNVKRVLSSAFASLANAGDAANRGLRSVVQTGLREAGGLYRTLREATGSALASIRSYRGMSMAELLEGDWEGGIDRAVQSAVAILEKVLAAVQRIVDRVRTAGHTLIDTSVDAGAEPVKQLGNSLASAVGGFAGTVAGVGKKMLGRFETGAQSAERGAIVAQEPLPVPPSAGPASETGQSNPSPAAAAAVMEGPKAPQQPARIALPVAISPALGSAKNAVGKMEPVAQEQTVRTVGKVGEALTGGIKTALKAEHDKKGLGAIARVVRGVRKVVSGSRNLIVGVGSGIKSFLRPGVQAARKVAELAKLAAKKAAAAAKAVGGAVKKVGGAVVHAAKSVGKAIAGGAKKVFGWLRSLF